MKFQATWHVYSKLLSCKVFEQLGVTLKVTNLLSLNLLGLRSDVTFLEYLPFMPVHDHANEVGDPGGTETIQQTDLST